jgi:hypothetical protein
MLMIDQLRNDGREREGATHRPDIADCLDAPSSMLVWLVPVLMMWAIAFAAAMMLF